MNHNEQVKLAYYVAKTFREDPVGFCKGVLRFTPDPWQKEVLEAIRDHRRVAVRSGHGVGKTRLAAAVIYWFMSTRAAPRIRATANTEKQILSVLWPELASLHRQAVNRELFTWSKTGFSLNDAPEVHFAQAVAWSEHNAEAFAGLHEKNVLYVFDEASGIPSVIWETASGAMTTSGAKWLVQGNPTRNSGKFYECFGKDQWNEGDGEESGKWRTITVSAETSPRVDKGYIAEQLREAGGSKDSDFYRVRVLGLPPKQEESQFIPLSLFREAMEREWIEHADFSRILAVDVARYGEDRTVIVEKEGNRIRKLSSRTGQDTMQTVGTIMEILEGGGSAERRGKNPLGGGGYPQKNAEKAPPSSTNSSFGVLNSGSQELEGLIVEKTPVKVVDLRSSRNSGMVSRKGSYDFVVVDDVGVGGGVVDRLRERGVKVLGVNTGKTSSKPEKFRNLRAELWWKLREFLKGEGSIEPIFEEDCCGIQYELDSSDRLQMERKEDMKRRGLRSPDMGDAACLLFAVPQKHLSIERSRRAKRPRKESVGVWREGGF